MKKAKLIACLIVVTIVALTLSLALVACNKKTESDPYTIVVGASQTPHSEILEVIKGTLGRFGYKLEIKVFDDYILPNTALEEGELDANFFQHTPYLETFNRDYGTDLVAVGKIHYEPFCIYGKNVSRESYGQSKTGRTILIPNDGSNLTRALFVLQDEGFITLEAGVSPSDTLTVEDIADSKGNTISPVDAPSVAAILAESANGTLAVVNGNYALQAGLSISDALAYENAEGEAASLYANVIAVKRGRENHSKTVALLSALRSQEVLDFINSTYNGAVRPVFTLD